MSADDGTAQLVADLWERSRNLVGERIAAVEDAVTAGERGAVPDDVRRNGAAAAHKLAGSLGSFGYTLASRRAAQLERLLGDDPDPDEPGSPRTLLEELRADLRRPPEPA